MSTIYTEHKFLWSYIFRVVFLIFLYEFFLPPFASVDTSSQFYYMVNSSESGYPVTRLPADSPIHVWSISYN